jgi:hypothetical protein
LTIYGVGVLRRTGGLMIAASRFVIVADVNIFMCGIDGGIVYHIDMFLLYAPILLAAFFLVRRRYKAAAYCGLAWLAIFVLNYIYKFHIFQCDPGG